MFRRDNGCTFKPSTLREQNYVTSATILCTQVSPRSSFANHETGNDWPVETRCNFSMTTKNGDANLLRSCINLSHYPRERCLACPKRKEYSAEVPSRFRPRRCDVVRVYND